MPESTLQDHLIALSQAVLAISSEQELDDVLQMIADRGRALLQARYAAVGVPDASGRRIERLLVSGLADDQFEAIGRMPRGHGLLGIMRREGQSLRLKDITSDPRAVGFPASHPPMRSFLGVPIRRGTEALGELYLTDKQGPDGFSAGDQELASMLAQHAALAIVNARLLGRLADSEQRYRLLTEGAPEIVFALDSEGRITFINDRVRTVTGFDPDALRGRHLRNVVHPADRPLVDLHLRGVQSGTSHTTFSASGIGRDGGIRHFEISLVPDRQGDAGFHGIAVDVTARRAREREMAERTSELLSTREERERLREFVALIIQAQETERARIAGDLHDTTVQTLTAIGRRLRALAADVPHGCEPLGGELSDLAGAALTEAEEMRRLSRNLRPSVLDHLGLAAALQHLAEELHADGLDVNIDVTGDAGLLDDRARTILFRIAQEALTNVRRHSGAECADVSLQVRREDAVLTVRDNGHGFDTASASMRPSARSTQLGLAGMRERAAMMGGSLDIHSTPGEGTKVTVSFPLDR